jgi:2-hydroxy-6-oxonona-2,4-dienedioate hydrolase
MQELRQHASSPADPWSEVERLRAAATRLETRFDGGKQKLVWHRWGEGPALVMFHGGGGSWTHWLRTLPALTPHFSVWIPDLPGYGDSDMPEGDVTYASIAELVADGAAELLPQDSRFDLVTFSFGGQLSVPFAKRFPTRLRKMVLVGANVIEEVPKALRFLNWKKAPTEAERDAAIRGNLLAIMLHDPARLDEFAMRLQKDNLARQRMNPARIGGHFNLRDALHELPPGMQLAGISGDNDFITRGRQDLQAAAFPKFRAGAEFHIVPAGSHWVMYDAAEAFNKVLLDILKKP